MIVDAEWLSAHLDETRVIDFRWYLGQPEKGRDQFEAGHIPGAVFVELEDVTGVGAGRHPLPTREQFQTAMREAGVNGADRVVVYDDSAGAVAARLWWMLRFFGHSDVSLLDGGLQAWTDPLETMVASKALPGDFVAREPNETDVLNYEQVRGLSKGVLLDARAGARYRGEQEPIDPKAGHIPGAVSADWEDNLTADRRFKSPEELAKHYKAKGVEPGNAVVYCGSGVTSCHNVIALERAGLGPVKLYAGSWSDWSSRSDAPVATGEKP